MTGGAAAAAIMGGLKKGLTCCFLMLTLTLSLALTLALMVVLTLALALALTLAPALALTLALTPEPAIGDHSQP